MKKGQFLIESWVALSILIVGFLGIFSLLSRSLSLNNVVASQYLASNLAAEGIEVVKNLIDANSLQSRPWNQGISAGSYEVSYNSLGLDANGDRFLRLDSDTNVYNYQTGSATPFKRLVEIQNIAADEIKVKSTVTWKSRGGSYSVVLEDYFFNWQQ